MNISITSRESLCISLTNLTFSFSFLCVACVYVGNACAVKSTCQCQVSSSHSSLCSVVLEIRYHCITLDTLELAIQIRLASPSQELGLKQLIIFEIESLTKPEAGSLDGQPPPGIRLCPAPRYFVTNIYCHAKRVFSAGSEDLN